MDINVKVRLESPELMAAILALAEALPQIKLSSVTQITQAQASEAKSLVYNSENKKAEVSKEEIIKGEAKTITLEALRERLAFMSKAGKQKEIKELIKKFGATKLTEVLPENYEALLKEAESL